jgi:hypothetical protein
MTASRWRRLAAIVGAAACSLALATAPRSVEAASSADDWPMFHYDQAHSGVSPDTSPGAGSVASLNLKWKTHVGGGKGIVASPAVVYNASLGYDLVYIASQGVTSTLAALRADTGAVQWSRTLPKAVRSSPAVSGNTVYVGAMDHVLYAFNATDGTPQCSYTTSGILEASPVVGDIDGTGDLVFIGDAGTGAATDAGFEWAINGVGNTLGQCTLRWKYNNFLLTNDGTRTGVWSPAALAQDVSGRWLVIFGTSDPDDAMYAVDALSGTEVWRLGTVTGGDGDVGAGPTVSAPGVNGITDGAVYVDGKDEVEYAVDLTTGAKLAGWTNLNLKKNAGSGAKSICTAALAGANLVLSFNQYVYDLDPLTGAVIWRSAATGTTTYIASPAVSGASGDQVILVGNLDGTEYAYALNGANGQAPLFMYQTGSTIVSSSAVSGGMVFFGALTGDLYALG